MEFLKKKLNKFLNVYLLQLAVLQLTEVDHYDFNASILPLMTCSAWCRQYSHEESETMLIQETTDTTAPLAIQPSVEMYVNKNYNQMGKFYKIL